MKMKFIQLFVLSLFGVACAKDQLAEPIQTEFTYLHTGHTRASGPNNNVVFEAAAAVDYRSFDMRWLGGDLSYFSTIDEAQVAYLDSIFDFGNPNTLLAPGNHEYADHPGLLEDATNRPLFYAHHFRGLTFLVFDTQGDDNHIRNEQGALFDAVVDTISQSSHLILLHHHLIWMMDGGPLQVMVEEVANEGIGTCFHCTKENNFYEDIYPKLVTLQKRGIEVICIGGDVGSKVRSFEHITAEGITFLGSGLQFNIGKDHNMALLFEHRPAARKLHWRFEPLSNLPVR